VTHPTYRLTKDISDRLTGAGLVPLDVEGFIARALAEDLDGGVDVTTMATVPHSQRSRLALVSRATGVLAGVPVAAAVFAMVGGEDVRMEWESDDGERVTAGSRVLSVHGPTHALLRAERPALNLLGHLGGIATLTARWVDAIAGTHAEIRDTRKTTPGLRALEKYAVRCGGGRNHRMSLADAALVKDNHVLAAGSVAHAFTQVSLMYPGIPIEVEVDSLDQLEAVVDAGADLVLLDNFTVDQMRTAVARVGGRVRLEASGGLTLETAAEVAATGVDYLAVGALTHSAPVLDIGADLETEG
jgi:nicotinate-nucleotide pyrophosphorylase (carboxylating)